MTILPAMPAQWHDRSSYRDYLRLDRPGFAWEFLRRNPGYRALARALHADRPAGDRARMSAAHHDAGRWGLLFRRR